MSDPAIYQRIKPLDHLKEVSLGVVVSLITSSNIRGGNVIASSEAWGNMNAIFSLSHMEEGADPYPRHNLLTEYVEARLKDITFLSNMEKQSKSHYDLVKSLFKDLTTVIVSILHGSWTAIAVRNGAINMENDLISVVDLYKSLVKVIRKFDNGLESLGGPELEENKKFAGKPDSSWLVYQVIGVIFGTKVADAMRKMYIKET